jgi:hypothetical protein
MHKLSASFVLGYHGCDRATAEKLLQNEPFEPSENDYDWLGSGIYFWESNPDRAMDWAKRQVELKKTQGVDLEPFVVGAIIDLGFCLDLMSSNGTRAVEEAHSIFQAFLSLSGIQPPKNIGGVDRPLRKLDCAVVNYLHDMRARRGEPSFDTVRGLFPEGETLYPGSGFRRETHVQICVRNQANIHGVFRVADRYFTR